MCKTSSILGIQRRELRKKRLEKLNEGFGLEFGLKDLIWAEGKEKSFTCSSDSTDCVWDRCWRQWRDLGVARRSWSICYWWKHQPGLRLQVTSFFHSSSLPLMQKREGCLLKKNVVVHTGEERAKQLNLWGQNLEAIWRLEQLKLSFQAVFHYLFSCFLRNVMTLFSPSFSTQ